MCGKITSFFVNNKGDKGKETKRMEVLAHNVSYSSFRI